jgi:hypothetical protein
MRSEIITVSQTSLDIDEEIPCNFKFGYVLQSADGTEPADVNVTIYASALEAFKEKLTLSGGKKVILPGSNPTPQDWNYVSFSQDIIQVGGALELPDKEKFRPVVGGLDNNLYNKSHKRKPFLERNQEARKPTAALFSREPRPKDGEKKGQGYEAIEKAKDNLLSGVFKKIGDAVIENAFKFHENWSYLTDDGSFVFRPIIIAKGEEDYSPEGMVKALKNVNVFSYSGPGDGNAILLGDTCGTLCTKTEIPPYRHQPYPNPVVIKDVIPQGALSNLYLVVIITCKWGGYTNPDFPIVSELVSRGAKCGIAVTGAKPASNPQGKKWEIFPPQALAWSEEFWQEVTKGYDEDEKSKKKVYPNISQAIEHTKKVVEKKKKVVVSVFTYGDTGIYLGDIPLK